MSKTSSSLMTLAELAAHWRVNVKTLRRLIASECLGVVKIGKSLRVTREEVARFERQNST